MKIAITNENYSPATLVGLLEEAGILFTPLRRWEEESPATKAARAALGYAAVADGYVTYGFEFETDTVDIGRLLRFLVSAAKIGLKIRRIALTEA